MIRATVKMKLIFNYLFLEMYSEHLHITKASLSSWTPFFAKGRHTVAQALGVRYERKAQQFLFHFCKGSYTATPWFCYNLPDNSHWKYCQPDGLFFDFNRNLIVIVEIKRSHTRQAWFQLRNLYEPVVRCTFGSAWQYAVCEVTSFFNPTERFPEKLHFVSHFSALQPEQFGLFVLRERKLNEYVRNKK